MRHHCTAVQLGSLLVKIIGQGGVLVEGEMQTVTRVYSSDIFPALSIGPGRGYPLVFYKGRSSKQSYRLKRGNTL